MLPKDHPFLHVTDPNELHPDERERYLDYWAKRTPNERLSEVYRLNRAKWGDEVFERGMDKTKFEVVRLSNYRE